MNLHVFDLALRPFGLTYWFEPSAPVTTAGRPGEERPAVRQFQAYSGIRVRYWSVPALRSAMAAGCMTSAE